MKRLLLYTLCLCLANLPVLAQDIDFARLAVTPLLAPNSIVPDADVKAALDNKVTRLLMANGLTTAAEGNSRFVLMSSLVIESKDVSSTVPTMYAVKLGLNMYFGDGIDGVLFSNSSVTISGIDRSETKAYLLAVRSLNVNNKEFTEFIARSKTKVAEYYASRCGLIMKEATTLATQHKYDEALYKLSAVPAISTECYTKAMAYGTEVFKAKVNYECAAALNRAKTFIAAQKYDEAFEIVEQIGPDADCYKQAQGVISDLKESLCKHYLAKANAAWVSHDYATSISYLSKIPPATGCAAQSSKLLEEIKAWYLQQEKQKLDMEMLKFKAEQNRSLETIRALRDVGVAFGGGQPKVVYKTPWF